MIPGWQLDIDSDCEAEEDRTACQDFISTENFFGVETRKKVTLKDNAKCTIMVDATAAVGRVTFDSASKLGVMVPNYVSGTPISIDKGDIRYVTIFNGNENGYMSFYLVFSSAARLGGVAAVALALLAVAH
uniref:Uncharacterized protein n=1 Tax=Strombidium inclinatum TaxID=197538 RepID=A0A7S3IDL5_9SPIT|mmetsp:Transcript_11503/g.17314  ORF Transcript_11503/g.17314 Transcript_11503/m.17314 type:complete len:131 (+) Transcript_11503:192-584(+)